MKIVTAESKDLEFKMIINGVDIEESVFQKVHLSDQFIQNSILKAVEHESFKVIVDSDFKINTNVAVKDLGLNIPVSYVASLANGGIIVVKDVSK